MWIASSLVEVGARLAGYLELVVILSGPAWTYDLPLFGFVGLMIFGMAQHFVPRFAGRALWRPGVGTIQVGLAVLAVVATLLLPPSARAVGLGLWLASAVLFVALVVGTLRSPATADRSAEHRAELRAIDRLAIPMTAAAIAYLVASSTGFFLAALPGDPLSLAPAWFAFLHLYTLGFVALMVFGVGFHLFPRFLAVAPPRRAVRIVQVLAIPGPAAVALAMPWLLALDSPRRAGFVVAATAEAIAALVFAALVLAMWSRSVRRPAAGFHAAGAVWLAIGVILGVLFGIDPLHTLPWVPAHGWINLLGFAGFNILGVLHEVLPPWVSRGPPTIRASTRWHLVVASLGLLSVAAAFGVPASGVAGDLLLLMGFSLLLAMAVGVAAGTLSTLAGIRATRRPSESRGP